MLGCNSHHKATPDTYSEANSLRVNETKLNNYRINSFNLFVTENDTINLKLKCYGFISDTLTLSDILNDKWELVLFISRKIFYLIIGLIFLAFPIIVSVSVKAEGGSSCPVCMKMSSNHTSNATEAWDFSKTCYSSGQPCSELIEKCVCDPENDCQPMECQVSISGCSLDPPE